MIRRSLIFIVLALSSGALVSAQTPEAKKDGETAAPGIFSFAFDSGGSYLGIQTADITKDNFGKYGLRDVRGVAVEKVMEGSPAQAAGLQNGDVITRMNGEEITSVRKLTRLVSEIAPDHQARITLSRGGQERELTVTLGKRPEPAFENGNFRVGPMAPGKIQMPDLPMNMNEFPKIQIAPGGENDMFVWRAGSSRQIGVSVSPLTKQLADHFGVAEGGLLINNVRQDSPAAKAGLLAGDIITEVDGKAITGDIDLIRAIGAKKEGDIELTVIRDRNRQTFRVTPEAFKGDGKPVIETFEKRIVLPGSGMHAAPAMPEMLRMPMVFGRGGSRVL